MNTKCKTRFVLASTLTLALLTGRATAQTAPAPEASPNAAAAGEETVVLSPFVVTADEDQGYTAKSTLAGTRVRTELKDVASSISVVTAQFLRDTGATNNQTLLQYTTNTEVGGIQGNFAGVGGTYIDGANESSNFIKPNTNTRVRGLDSADNTRDFFQTDIPWDSYNVGRVDLQRGPNSILFGIGSPAGIINSSVNTAGFKNEGKIENRLGSFGTVRNSLDVNRVILDKELAVRFAALNDQTKYRQQYTFNNDNRLFGAVRWDPKFFANDSIHTTVRANYEHGKVSANRPRVLPPQDRITGYFSGMKQKSYDPFWAWNSGQVPYSSSTTLPGYEKDYWIVQYPGPGLQTTSNPVFVYDNNGAAAPSITRQAGPTTEFGLNADGTIGHGIDGFPYGSNIGLAGYNEYAYDTWRVNNATTEFPAADKGFYKNKSLTDTSIFNYFENLIDGPNKHEWAGWDSTNVVLSQTFLDSRLGYELVYDRQKYHDGQESNLNNPYISVDIRKNLMVYPENGNLPVTPNPNVGRAFTGSSAKGNNNGSTTDRKSVRATIFGEVKASDFLGQSKLAGILGHHLFTGLYSKDSYSVLQQNWVRYAVDSSWTAAIGNQNGGLVNGDVVLDWMTYLSPSLASLTTPRGLNLSGVTVTQSPAGSFNIPYYDSHWAKSTNPADPNYVDPAAPWINTARASLTEPNGAATTQSENPANYVGWVSKSFNVLNADTGDRDRLLTGSSNVEKKTTSKAITWQGYFWDDTIVATFGARRDRQEQRFGSSSADMALSNGAGVADPNPTLSPLTADSISEGNSVSWGVVMHTPKGLRKKLPYGSDISLTYSDGRNTRVENRYGFDGAALPNAKGRTKDFGVVLSTLDDRLQLKITTYKTTVSDANLSSVTTEASTLGNNTYYLRNLEAWGTASAMIDLAGREVDSNGNSLVSGWEWYWNWALIDNGWDGKYNNPKGADFLNSPVTQHQTAVINSWLAQMPAQSWFDAYGFSVNVAKAKAGDWRNAIAGWTPFAGVGGVQPSGGGRIKGSWPTGTANNESKGLEFELSGQPIRGLNLSINASKQTASQTSLGANLVNTIETAYAKYTSDAGDLRLWWGGDSTVRQYFTQNIWSAYQFQLQTNGKLVAEMAPWRFNAVANYNFSTGLLKGVNAGFGYRWNQGVILGYALNAAKDNLDVNNPYWGKAEDHIDFWAGYSHRLNQKLDWRIQINLRNLGEKTHLRTISVEPDGSSALARIEEGMTWQLTNTISF